VKFHEAIRANEPLGKGGILVPMLCCSASIAIVEPESKHVKEGYDQKNNLVKNYALDVVGANSCALYRSPSNGKLQGLGWKLVWVSTQVARGLGFSCCLVILELQ
jgi:hypothetical protein